MQLDLQTRPLGKIPLRPRLKSLALRALIIGVVALAVSRTPRDFSLTLEQVRPLAQIAALLLGAVAAWGTFSAVRSLAQRPRQVAWGMSVRLVGWIGLVVSAGGVAVLALQDVTNGFIFTGPARAVELIVPVVLAVQAALIFSPSDEPGLEVLVACPRPASWLLLERVALLFLAQSAVALAGVAFCRLVDSALDVPLTLLRWLPPALLLTGLGVLLTLRTQLAAFGAVFAGAVWFTFVFFGAAFLPGAPTFWPMTLLQPFIWMVNPFLQPGDVPTGDYGLNRILVAALGVVLLMLAARYVNDEERLLLNSRKKK